MPPQPDLAVRDGDWKLLCDYDGSKPELYDLARDRGETDNRAAEHPDIVRRLAGRVVAWHKSMPPDNGPMLANAPPAAGKKKKGAAGKN